MQLSAPQLRKDPLYESSLLLLCEISKPAPEILRVLSFRIASVISGQPVLWYSPPTGEARVSFPAGTCLSQVIYQRIYKLSERSRSTGNNNKGIIIHIPYYLFCHILLVKPNASRKKQSYQGLSFRSQGGQYGYRIYRYSTGLYQAITREYKDWRWPLFLAYIQ